MKRKQVFRLIKYYLQYFPFTVNILLYSIAAYFGYKILYQPLNKDEIAPFRPFIILMGKITFWFLIVLVGLSVISTVMSWLYFLWLRNKKQYKLQVSFKIEHIEGHRKKMYLHTLIEGVFRPILGFVKARLYYDDNQLTDKFTLLSNKRREKSIWREAITGKSGIVLPDIKEYEIKGGFVFFQDMLQLCSLAVAQPISGHFHQPPLLSATEDKEVFPKKTETTDVRIEQLRRVEGEHLNYKDFEAGDDVRRIVWKVYAKNRELVVRIPELYEPYASHLYFYASFDSTIQSQWLNETYLKEMLNYYKNNIWTIYNTLSKKEWTLRYIPDQQFNILEQLSDTEKTSRIISNSNWIRESSLEKYFNPKHGTVLCISSLTSPEDLENLLARCDESIVIYFVKLSSVFKQFAILTWAKRILFLPPKDRLSKIRATWLFSPLRLQILKREKTIETILNKNLTNSAVL